MNAQILTEITRTLRNHSLFSSRDTWATIKDRFISFHRVNDPLGPGVFIFDSDTIRYKLFAREVGMLFRKYMLMLKQLDISVTHTEKETIKSLMRNVKSDSVTLDLQDLTNSPTDYWFLGEFKVLVRHARFLDKNELNFNFPNDTSVVTKLFNRRSWALPAEIVRFDTFKEFIETGKIDKVSLLSTNFLSSEKVIENWINGSYSILYSVNKGRIEENSRLSRLIKITDPYLNIILYNIVNAKKIWSTK